MNKSRGVVYMAVNNKWLKESCCSAKSVKQHCAGLPVTLFTNRAFESKNIDDVRVSTDMEGTRFKFNYLDKTPYDYTLFLDSDTQVMTNICSDFDVLDKFDIALTICICRVMKDVKILIPDYGNIPDSFNPFQGGFMMYRKTEKVINFIKLWKTLYCKYKEEFGMIQDQPSLRVALWNSDLRIHTLPIEYNLKDYRRIKKFYSKIKPKIIHDHKLFEKSSNYKIKNFKLVK